MLRWARWASHQGGNLNRHWCGTQRRSAVRSANDVSSLIYDQRMLGRRKSSSSVDRNVFLSSLRLERPPLTTRKKKKKKGTGSQPSKSFYRDAPNIKKKKPCARESECPSNGGAVRIGFSVKFLLAPGVQHPEEIRSTFFLWRRGKVIFNYVERHLIIRRENSVISIQPAIHDHHPLLAAREGMPLYPPIINLGHHRQKRKLLLHSNRWFTWYWYTIRRWSGAALRWGRSLLDFLILERKKPI